MRCHKSLIAALLALFAMDARAETFVTGEPNHISARFTSNPASVTVDVQEIGGTQIGNNLAATHQQIDAVNSDVWTIDLAAVAGYPTDCTQKSYIVRFQPNTTADCSAAGSPSGCSEQIIDVGGSRCRDPNLDVSYYRTNAPVAAQGISAAVVAYEERRGRAPIRWTKTAYTDRGGVKYEVFFYTVSLGFPHLKCTVNTTSDPSAMDSVTLTALGNSSTCTAGN